MGCCESREAATYTNEYDAYKIDNKERFRLSNMKANVTPTQDSSIQRPPPLINLPYQPENRDLDIQKKPPKPGTNSVVLDTQEQLNTEEFAELSQIMENQREEIELSENQEEPKQDRSSMQYDYTFDTPRKSEIMERQSASSAWSMEQFLFSTFVINIQNRSLEELINELPNDQFIRVHYQQQTWAERPTSRGAYSALVIAELLDNIGYPEDNQNSVQTIKEFDAVGKLIDGLFSKSRDRQETFAVCLDRILNHEDPDLSKQLTSDDVLSHLLFLLSDEKSNMRITISNILAGIYTRKPNQLSIVFSFEDNAIVKRMLELLEYFNNLQDLYDQLHNIRYLYIDQDDEVVDRNLKRIVSLGLKEGVKTAIYKGQQFPEEGNITKQEFQDLIDALYEDIELLEGYNGFQFE